MAAGDPIVQARSPRSTADDLRDPRAHLFQAACSRRANPLARARSGCLSVSAWRARGSPAAPCYSTSICGAAVSPFLGDQSADQALGPSNWQALARQLTEDLRSTDPERAIAHGGHPAGRETAFAFSRGTMSKMMRVGELFVLGFRGLRDPLLAA